MSPKELVQRAIEQGLITVAPPAPPAKLTRKGVWSEEARLRHAKISREGWTEERKAKHRAGMQRRKKQMENVTP